MKYVVVVVVVGTGEVYCGSVRSCWGQRGPRDGYSILAWGVAIVQCSGGKDGDWWVRWGYGLLRYMLLVGWGGVEMGAIEFYTMRSTPY